MSGEQINITGSLSKDPELKYAQNGTAVCRFSIPTNRKVGDEYKTAWWNITTLGKLAETVNKLASKGTILTATGFIDLDHETMAPAVFEKDGVHRSALKLLANSIDFIANYGKKAEAEKPAAQEELPF